MTASVNWPQRGQRKWGGGGGRVQPEAHGEQALHQPEAGDGARVQPAKGAHLMKALG